MSDRFFDKLDHERLSPLDHERREERRRTPLLPRGASRCEGGRSRRARASASSSLRSEGRQRPHSPRLRRWGRRQRW